MYVIVEFEDSGDVCYVPSEYVDDKMQCSWSLNKTKEKMYRDEFFPPRKEWKIYAVKKIIGIACSLKEAKRKEKKPQYTSNIDDTEPDSDDNKKKKGWSY